jgi:hypothetical protein
MVALVETWIDKKVLNAEVLPRLAILGDDQTDVDDYNRDLKKTDTHL